MNTDNGRVPEGTGLSQAEPQERLVPSGFDPSRNIEEAIATMGRRVEARRKVMGLTLEQVAQRSGLAKSYVWEIENGKNKNPTIRTAWHLAGALGWTLSEVIGVWEHSSLLHPEAMKIAVQVDWLLRPKFALSDSDGSPKGGDACGSVHDSAGPKDIAR
jgi:transcriptional regulator with XRE-family HTH domain